MHEFLKDMQVSIDYNRKLIDMIRARREKEEKEVELHFLGNNDEDIKLSVYQLLNLCLEILKLIMMGLKKSEW